MHVAGRLLGVGRSTPPYLQQLDSRMSACRGGEMLIACKQRRIESFS
jgi:hypothetical protein